MCSHALPLSNPLAQGLFFMRLNSLSYQKKRGTRRRWKDIEREKKKQFRDSHSFVCGKFYFFSFYLPQSSMSVKFNCVSVCVSAERERGGITTTMTMSTQQQGNDLQCPSSPFRTGCQTDQTNEYVAGAIVIMFYSNK